MKNIFNLPNFISLFRLIFSPLMLPLLIYFVLPHNSLLFNCIIAAVFIFLSFTDFFDGYLARRFGQVTGVGKSLDHIADKFLITSVLISLLAVNKIFFYWVIILVGRHLFMMGVRIVSLEKGFPLPVSLWGKVNTLVQMIYLSVVIINPYQNLGFSSPWNIIETLLLAIVILLSIFSVKKYIDEFIIQYMMRSKGESEKRDFSE